MDTLAKPGPSTTSRVGVGLCTYNRPGKALQVAKAIRNTTKDIYLVVSIDGGDVLKYDLIEMGKYCDEIILGKNEGVVKNKNRLITYLQGCDYIFLIEDDLVPIKEGWVELYIKAMQATSYHHLNFIHLLARDKMISQRVAGGINIAYYKNLGGALMIFTKKCLSLVGLFDPKYKFYGYCHCDYTRRCQLAGMYPKDFGHPHLVDIDKYLVLDVSIPSATPSALRDTYVKSNGVRYQGGSPRVAIPLHEFYAKSGS